MVHEKPNFTLLSNFFIDEKMKLLSDNAVKTFIAYSREITERTGYPDYRQLMTKTGLSKIDIICALNELKSHGMILQQNDKKLKGDKK